jgi:hypothetical protein
MNALRKLFEAGRLGLALVEPVFNAIRNPTAENETRAFDALDAFTARERKKIDEALIRKHSSG